MLVVVVACFTSQQHAGVCKEWTCSDRCMSGMDLLRQVCARNGPVQTGVCQEWTCSDRCVSGMDLLRQVCVRNGPAQTGVCQEWTCSDRCMSGMDLLRQVYVRNGPAQTGVHAADHTCYLTQTQYTDTGPTSPSNMQVYLRNRPAQTIEHAADHTYPLTQTQYTDTGPTNPSSDPVTPGSVATGVSIFNSFLIATGKYRLYSMASLAAFLRV